MKKCNYCDFISYPFDADLAASYVYALAKEVKLQAAKMTNGQRQVRTVYLGGGTPSLLSGEHLVLILENCRKHFRISSDAEITVECNPGTVTREKIALMRRAGVNRISLGVQAYQPKLLAFLGRTHSFNEVTETVKACRYEGIDNINCDLIYGIPMQQRHDWQETIERVLDLSPVHISAYGLKVEPGTPLYKDIASGSVVPCDEEAELEMYRYAINILAGNGYKHYEISNFAFPGKEARHNLIYWFNKEYLGLGPAAHSMLNCQRFSNVKCVASYIKKLEQNEPVVAATTQLSLEDEIAETIFLGLRLLDGLDTLDFARRFGCSVADIFRTQLEKLADQGLIKIAENRIKLTEKGLPLANEVFVEFI
ncbi:radical SAM family heme chaperone HemW [Phosphitispora sp. TUW77]|uniref:radical SAM family heme chaperone HemW n=1 Tax=Phosphitispora sp. TUW77 TaxID=3152361 RepID=UPI003AB13D4C